MSNSKTNILFAIDNLIRGGTELQLIGLINNLPRDKYNVHLLTIRETDENLIPENCSYLSWSVRKIFSLHGLLHVWRLYRYLKDNNIKITQSYFQDSTLLVYMAAFIARVPLKIACLRDLGFWVTGKDKLVLARVYRGVDKVICNADMVKAHFVNLFRLKEEKVFVVRNGIKASDLNLSPFREKCTDIGIVGNMSRKVKRTDLFIKAAGVLAESYPEIFWHIIGDGELRAELEALAQELGVSGSIKFVGRIDNVTEYLDGLDVGVICSDSEGLSNALVEYMYKGVASVATAVGGNVELIKDGETGLLVERDDVSGLAEALKRLIDDSCLRKSIWRNARAFVENEYSWERCIASHEFLYKIK